jgi:hypothetical protein
MSKTVMKKCFDVNDEGDRILIAIHEESGKFNYTVADADGPRGLSETLEPFLESEYVYTNMNEAFDAAQNAYVEYLYG